MIPSDGGGRCALQWLPAVLYDTEIVPAGGLEGRTINLFLRPIGQTFEWGYGHKTWAQTNMVQCGQLPTPSEMRMAGFRMGMDKTRPYLDRLRLYCRAVVEIRIMSRIEWIGPMSIVPCGNMLEFPERDEKEFVFEDRGMPPLVNLDPISGQQLRLRSAEQFGVRLLFPDASGLEEGEPAMRLDGPVPVAFYFYGIRFRMG